MSANGAALMRPDGMPIGKPFHAGDGIKRSPMSKAERDWREALDTQHIPRASDLLKKMIDKGLKGDTKAAMVAFKVMGLIRKQTDEAAIADLAQKLLDGMLEEARARRAANGGR